MIQTPREEDIACRCGGEEFVVILRNADLNAAMEAAERIRAGFEKISFRPDLKKEIFATVSIGVAELLPQETTEQLLSRFSNGLTGKPFFEIYF